MPEAGNRPLTEPGAPKPPGEGGRVVLVHDWLTGMRGGEKVLESLCRLFPKADLCTLVHKPGSVSALIEDRRIRTSVIQRLPMSARRYREYLPLFPSAIEWFDLDDADLVISTSHCAAKAIVRTGRARHICYCHSPMRYAWDQFDHYFGADRIGRAGNLAARMALAPLARWDRATAHRVDRYIANSAYVAGRIARYYNRHSTVLHPPVDTRFFTPDGAPSSPDLLVVSALVPYKRLELAIDAAARTGATLNIVGSGPDEPRLRARAGQHVRFLGSVDDNALRELYRRARAVILPGEEDFGIVPVEAMACGRPVVALGRGGALETVVPGTTGLLTEEPTVEAFAEALSDPRLGQFDQQTIRAHAETFDRQRFETAFAGLVAETIAQQPIAC